MAGYDPQYISEVIKKATAVPMYSGGTTKKTKDKSGTPSYAEIAQAVNSAATGEVKNVGGALSAIEALRESGVVTDSQASILKQNVKNNAAGAYIKPAPTADELRKMHR